MKTIIYWFSATGNSLAAARRLAAALAVPGEGPVEMRAMAAELRRAGEAGRIRLPEGTGRAVLVFPLYYLSWPRLVGDFLDRLEIPAGLDVAAVVSRGMRHMGAVLGDLDARLRGLGSRLRLGRYVEMPNNDIILFNGSGAGQIAAKLGGCDTALTRFAAEIRGGRRGRTGEMFGFMRGIRYPVYLEKIHSSHERFWAESACSACGTCVRVCALGRIRLEAGHKSQ
jgi:hypothetical protein